MSGEEKRAWAWRQSLPPEEKLLLLAIVEAEHRGEPMKDRPDTKLPPLIDEAAYLTGLGHNGAQAVGRRLHTRGLIGDDGTPKPTVETPAAA